ncbi:MAG: hypothetical protein WA945_09440, partial [Arcobacteraceae bacterium]
VIQSEIIFLKKRLRQNKAYALINKEDDISKKLLRKAGLTFEKNIILKNRGDKEVYSKNL